MSTPVPIVVPDEVRPPAYWLAPNVRRLSGYVWAPAVLAVVGAAAALVQAVTR